VDLRFPSMSAVVVCRALSVPLVLGFVGCVDDVQPEAGTTEIAKVSVDVRECSAAKTGESCSVAVLIENAADVFGVAADLTYNPEEFAYLESNSGGFLGNDGSSTSAAFALQDGHEGRLVVGLSRVGDAGGVGGEGMLCRTSFRRVAEGEGRADFAISNLYVLDADLDNVGHDVEILQ